MKSTVSVIAPTSIKLDFNLSSLVVGINPLPIGGITDVTWTMPTPSPLYASALIIAYIVEVDGVINVTDINLNFITKNNSNCNTKIQISGDGGQSWVDITDDIPGDGVNYIIRQGSGQWLSNIQIGKAADGLGMFRVRFLIRSINGLATQAKVRADSSISIEYNKIVTGALLPTPEIYPTIGRGFVSGGINAAGIRIATNERFNDVTNAWTGRLNITARDNLSAYSFFMTDYGFTSGGINTVPAYTGTTERFDDIANTQTARLAITARAYLTAFAISLPAKPLPNMYGYTSCGTAGAGDLGTTQRYDNDANTQTARTAATARYFLAGYSMFGAGFTSCGYIGGVIAGKTERLDDTANAWTGRLDATPRISPAGYSIRQYNTVSFNFHPLGYTSGGATAFAVGTTERFEDYTNTHTARTGIDPRYRLAGFSMLGYGYTVCGYDIAGAVTGKNQRFDDITNTQITRTSAPTVRAAPAGYSLEENFIQFPQAVGHGFTSCGNVLFPITLVGITERFDDTTNAQVSRSPATSRTNPAGFGMLGFGYTSCGNVSTGISNTGLTERFDDTVDNHTARASATARRSLAGYSFNNFGFTSCGIITVAVGTTEKFDDIANTWTSRADATARLYPAGFNIGNFGFIACGLPDPLIPVATGLLEKFDDISNTHIARLSDPTPRSSLTAYSMLGFGFTSCGYDDSTGNALGTTERFDDGANTWTARAVAFTRTNLAGYSFNNFGFTSCGFFSDVQRITERFDDGANTHTLRANAFPRYSLTGYAI